MPDPSTGQRARSGAPSEADGSSGAGSGAGGRRPFDPIYHYYSSSRQPRSARSLPAIARSATRLARRASPRLFYACSGAQLAIAGLLAVQVLLGKLALEAIIASSQTGGSVGDALLPLVGLVAASGLSSVLTAFQTLGQRLLGEVVQRTTLSSTLAVTTAVDLETFESPAFYDDVQRVQANALTRPLTMSQGVVQLLGGVVGAASLLVVLIAIEPLLVTSLLVAPLPLWFLSRRSGGLEFGFNVAQTPGQRLRLYLVEVMSGRDEAKELRAFGLGDVLRRRWEASYATYLADLRTHIGERLMLAIGAALATIVATSGAFALLIWLLVEGRVGLAEAGAAVFAIRLLSSRTDLIFRGVSGLFESSLFLIDLQRFLDAAPVATSTREANGQPKVKPFEELVLDDVSFSYPEAEGEALRGVSIRIRRGEVVALVGENGSGKTTLAKLVAALFTPTSGRILWDGVDVTTLDPEAVREQIGVIFQDFIRYELTARENIGFGRPRDIEDTERIEAAARQANAHCYLDALPEGYSTMLGKSFQGGYDLSLGQWQRVALARAFFRQAQLLVLDEPTASLDARREYELFEDVRRLGKERSVLLISHRFSTVRSADRIYVMRAGKVTEEGTHEELMGLEGHYAALFNLQAAGYSDVLGPRGR